MTKDQRTLERFEFMCEDGANAVRALAATPEDDWEQRTLLNAASALDEARIALSHAYDVVGAAAKDRRREASK
jgi:hypothetical protein